MFDVITVGSIAVDLYFKGKSLTKNKERFNLAIGGKYVTDFFDLKIGGGGVNVAIGCYKNGLRPAIVGIIGINHFKKFILDELEKHKITTKFCRFEDQYYNISAILLSENGERTIIHYSTPHKHLIDNNQDLLGITKTSSIYLGNLPDVSLSERKHFLHFFKKRNILTVLNLGVKDCRREKKQLIEILNMVDILIINGHEFAELVKAPYKDINFKDNVINWYIPILNDQIVIITQGEKGSFGYYRGKVFFQKAFSVKKIIDTTGAGDGYTAGFLSSYLKTKDIERSMFNGAKYASHILEKIGAN